MAYQNVGTPRFYVNVLDWLGSNGAIQISDVFRTLPVDMDNSLSIASEDGFTAYGDKNFIALLGHTLNSDDMHFNLTSGSMILLSDIVNLGDSGTDNGYKPEYDGFTIATFSDEFVGMVFNVTDVTNIGSIVIGSYYDMPHSPDLKLTMTREMDGVKRIRTKGGADLVDHKYYKPAPWGTAGAWELYSDTPPQALSRSGRRTWDLSFSYLSSKDIMGAVELSFDSITEWTLQTPATYTLGGGTYGGTVLTGLGWDQDDIHTGTDSFLYSLLDHNDFYSQVIHKTNGGQLPFIFQPDAPRLNTSTGLYEGGDNTQFAICKFDMKSFKFEQVANGIYNVKLKIREVW